jgi:hypothetical protein
MKRKAKRYNEGELVDSFSEYQGFGQMGPRTIQEDINAAAEEEKKRPKIKESISVSEFAEPGGAGFSRTSVTKAPAKAPIVTKEQMQKAGFDNLRDYMNAQKGLTRRGEAPKPAKAPAAKPAKSEGPSMSSYAPDARAGRSTNVSYLRKDRLGMEPDMYIARRRMKEGFKAGGKVSSASKRADGIATKGKTRGKYI